jgi:AraC-like DNA-binding protein
MNAFAQRLVAAHADLAMKAVFQRRSHPLDGRIARALPLIRERMAAAGGAAGMTEVAQQVGLSRSRFFELFRVCIGVSPLQYRDWFALLRPPRLWRAATPPWSRWLPRSASLPPAHFTRFFSQHAGMPPSAFRRAAGFRGARPSAAGLP